MTNHVVPITHTTVLKNKGFPVLLHVVAKGDNGRWYRETDLNGDETVTEQFWLRLTNRTIASIEEPEPMGFGGLGAWEEQSSERSFSTIAKTLAIVEDVYTEQNVPDVAYGATRLLDGGIVEYVVAMQSAVMIAQGIKPEVVRDFLAGAVKSGRTALDEQSDVLMERIRELLKGSKEDATQTSPNGSTTGTDSSEHGAEPVEALTSSGT